MKNSTKDMVKVVALCKNRGFVYSGSEIYGGLANAWDYGPLGIELKNNIKKMWWNSFIRECEYNVGLDSAILMNSQTWVASGHVGGFSDPLIDCKNCKVRHRADHLIEESSNISVNGWSSEQLKKYIVQNNVKCPRCRSSDFTNIRQFNLMFQTSQGVTEESQKDESNKLYLRPETAQGIFVNFKNVQRSTRRKIPFGIGQIGKSFRNEITPGNFIFRTREFEQMELEFFCRPDTHSEWFNFWRSQCYEWLENLGINSENIRFRDHEKEELSHYSSATTDIEYLFPFGWSELWGIADRGSYDLVCHSKCSGQELDYLDPETNERYIPSCIEPSLGVDRLFLALLIESYDEEVLEDGTSRVILKIHPKLAPIKLAILPLSKKLSQQALEIYKKLSKHFTCEYDESGSIGKRYRRQDEIGTPFCVTYDFDSIEDNKVTLRNRDTMSQIRVPICDIQKHLLT